MKTPASGGLHGHFPHWDSPTRQESPTNPKFTGEGTAGHEFFNIMKELFSHWKKLLLLGTGWPRRQEGGKEEEMGGGQWAVLGGAGVVWGPFQTLPWPALQKRPSSQPCPQVTPTGPQFFLKLSGCSSP